MQETLKHLSTSFSTSMYKVTGGSATGLQGEGQAATEDGETEQVAIILAGRSGNANGHANRTQLIANLG